MDRAAARRAKEERFQSGASGEQCDDGNTGCLDACKCYRVRGRRRPAFAATTASLSDQFTSSAATVIRPVAICNPASLDGAALIDPAAHLACCKIAAASSPAPVRVESASALGSVRLKLSKRKLFCLPSTAAILP